MRIMNEKKGLCRYVQERVNSKLNNENIIIDSVEQFNSYDSVEQFNSYDSVVAYGETTVVTVRFADVRYCNESLKIVCENNDADYIVDTVLLELSKKQLSRINTRNNEREEYMYGYGIEERQGNTEMQKQFGEMMNVVTTSATDWSKELTKDTVELYKGSAERQQKGYEELLCVKEEKGRLSAENKFAKENEDLRNELQTTKEYFNEQLRIVKEDKRAFELSYDNDLRKQKDELENEYKMHIKEVELERDSVVEQMTCLKIQHERKLDDVERKNRIFIQESEYKFNVRELELQYRIDELEKEIENHSNIGYIISIVIMIFVASIIMCLI